MSLETKSEIKKTLKSLKSRKINGIYAENRKEANVKILDLIPLDAVVGIGDSTTNRQIGIIEALKDRNTKVLDGFKRGISQDLHRDFIRESTLCDVFLTGTNAITLDGRLVNVDGAGNRVAGMFFGHPISIIIVGRNKLVKNLDQAFHRIRKLIAPNHIKIRRELGGFKQSNFKRSVSVFTIIEGKTSWTEIYVVIVNEDLGLAWDKSWSNERISRIIEEYKKFVWIPPSNYKVTKLW